MAAIMLDNENPQKKTRRRNGKDQACPIVAICKQSHMRNTHEKWRDCIQQLDYGPADIRAAVSHAMAGSDRLRTCWFIVVCTISSPEAEHCPAKPTG